MNQIDMLELFNGLQEEMRAKLTVAGDFRQPGYDR